MTEQPFTTAKFAVLWDLDGVICDSGELHYEAWVKAFGEHHISFDHAAFERSFGMNNTGILRLLLPKDTGRVGPDVPQEQIDRIGDEKEELFRRLIAGRLECLPGVRRMLATLQEAGFPPERLHLTYWGIPLQRFHPARNEVLRRRLGMDGSFVVAIVGRIEEQKGMWTLLRAM